MLCAAFFQIVCFAILECSGSECEFDHQWRGRWSSDLNTNEEIGITHNEISSKGLCYQQYREYHLIENRREHCHQCLLLHQKHQNILQYRESYCIGRTALQSICGQIEVDRHLSVYTLVRVDAVPSECPLLRAYHVTYSNFSGCFCRSPTSYAHTCSSPSSFVFRLRQCRQCSNTFEQNVELDCLATWKEGTKHFGIGKFSSYSRKFDGNIRDDDDDDDEDDDDDDDDDDSRRISRYRCFMYHILGAVAYISVSANASCDSLKSAREGPFLLELTEDFFGWPASQSCSFPSWLTASTWFLVANTHHIFEASDSNDTIIVRSTLSSPSVIHKSFKCLKIDQPNSTSPTSSMQIQVLTQAFNKCQVSHRCVSISRKRRNMVSLQIGDEVNGGGRCTEGLSTSRMTSLLLIASTEHEDSRCPFRGRYLSTSSTGAGSTCRLEMKIACGSGDRIEVMDQCFPAKIERMDCLSWWRDHGVTHLIAERTGSNSFSCFAFQHLGEGILVSRQKECLRHFDDLPIRYNSSSVLIQFKADKCRERASLRSNEHSVDSYPPSIVQSDDFQRPRSPVPDPTEPKNPSTSPSHSSPSLVSLMLIIIPRIFSMASSVLQTDSAF